jgi:transcriptional regulator of acetoin/glycerol metabolism
LAPDGGGGRGVRARAEPPRWSPEGLRRTQRARERLLSTGTADRTWATDGLIRPEIAASWRRSLMMGVDPSGRRGTRYDPDREAAPRLLRAAEPVLDRLVQQLEGTSTAVVLADSKAWILWRGAGVRSLFAGLDRIDASLGCCMGEEVVGTNGLGTVIEERRPSVIVGGEHYQDNMQDFTCVGVPVLHPLNGRLEGVLDLTCRSRDTNELLLPLLTEAVREIGQRLREQASVREHALFDEFIKQTRRQPQAVASLNEDFLITNAAAAQLFEPADHALLWDWASNAVATGTSVAGELRLTRDIEVHARCAPVDDGDGSPAGVVITMTSTPGRDTRARSDRTRSRAWQLVLRQVGRLARMDGPVLLRGEPGVGKVHLARRLHDTRDANGAFVTLDCRAHRYRCAAWLDEVAHAVAAPGATVVLRHVHELPDPVAGAVSGIVGSAVARIVLSAVDESAHEAASPAGGGIADLAEVTVTVPPLRERLADLPALVSELLTELSGDEAAPRCTGPVLSALKRQPWPENIRELRRVLATALVNCMHFDLTIHDLPPGYRQLPARRALALLESTERDAIVTALRKTGWNKDEAAAELGISRATIYRKIKRFGIRTPALGG